MFPAALNVYWLINNILSLVQVSLLRTQWARNYFGITRQKPDPSIQSNMMTTRSGELTKFFPTSMIPFSYFFLDLELEDALRIINEAIKNTPREELIQKLGKLKKEEK